ncbi:hypothetical protein KY290_024913 [Solanum tuberosum]|uniref:Uncharacterized protein n=1 Tax=Solanum tuberosum TaxID=4113 RepID=A0ABQ7UU23_SOLTU|nr:hypothetical protein KY284_023768 [Solanum tuberosum]KAH0754643.1 hypothetical protein KY290_024913 [Solanum tuberosum]
MEYYAGIAKYDIINIFASLPFLEHVQLNSSILKFLAANTGDEVPKKLPADLKLSFPYLQYLEIEVADDYTRAEIPTLECLEVEGFSNMTFRHSVKLSYKAV